MNKTIALHDSLVHLEIDALIPYARNSRTHSEAQVAQIAGSIREFGFTNPVLIDDQGGIIAGHGRVLAARKLGLKNVPCIVLNGLTDTQRRAYVIADNRLAENSGWDMDMLAAELEDLRLDDFDLDLLGFDAEALEKMFDEFGEDKSEEGGQNDSEDETYTRKIVSPIYEPKGKCPATADLFDDSKADSLINEIRRADLPPDVAAFLTAAAQRHTVFHFARIAEFYAHASADVQDLMERSALVIIDFDKAIENGFVALTERLGELADLEGFNDAK